MHLGIVSPFPPEISGIGQYGWNLAHGLAGTGRFERLTVFSARPHPALRPADAPAPHPRIAVRSVWDRGAPLAGRRVLQAVRAARPDVLWFNLGFSVFGASRAANFSGLAGPWLVQQAGYPAVVTLHEIFEATPPHSVGARNGRLTAWGARAATHLLLRAQAVCVTLRRYADHLRRAYGAANIQHIPHGAFAAPEALPRGAGPPEILMLATHAPHKGLATLLEALPRVRAARPEVRLIIAGSDHPRFAGYLAEVRAQWGRVEHLEWRERLTELELRELFARASVVVAPYLASTGASSVVHRAAAFGRPLVVSDLPDFRALAEEEGLRLDYAPPGDAPALAAGLLRQLADRERAAAQTRHNLRAMQAMSLEQTSARYAALLTAAGR